MEESSQNRSSGVQFADTLQYVEFVALAITMTAICVVTILGNTLVLLSFIIDRKLRTLNNYFLLSLAISDMMIATFAMPLFTLYILKGRWTLGPVICDMWLAQDYMCSMASSMNLLMIGFDRFFSVVSPLRYRARRTGKLVAKMISLVWILSFLVWPPWIYSWQYIEGKRTVPDDDCYVQFLETNSYLTVLTAALAYYIPVAIMFVLYFKIWRETVKRKQFLIRMESEQYSTMSSSHFRDPHRKTERKSFYSKLFCCHQTSRPKCSLEAVENLKLLTITSESKEILSDTVSSISDKNDQQNLEDIELEGKKRRKYNLKLMLCCSSKYETRTEHNSQRNVRNEDLVPTNVASKQQNTDHDVLQNPNESNQIEKANVSDKYPTLHEPDSSNVQPLAKKNLFSRLSSLNADPVKHDNKATRVLLAILLAFLITTTPYNVVVIIKNFDLNHTLVPDAMWYFVYYMFYVNSTLNPICYALGNVQFRKTYWKILTCSWRFKSIDNSSFISSTNISNRSKS